MKDLKKTYGSWALVAGAAEGMGAAYSIALAERGLDLILVDHQKALLHTFEDQLRQNYGIKTHRLAFDLAEPESVGKMIRCIKETGCRLIIYNAAFSLVKPFLENNSSELDRYIHVNMRTPIQMIHAFLAYHADTPERRKGIILMSSLAGWWGTQLLAPYGASKAFNAILAEALHHEFKHQNVDVLACIAGATSTPAYLETNPQYGRIRPHIMNPGKVVSGALDTLGRTALYVPGFHNRLTFFILSRILARPAAVRLMNRTVSQMYRDRF